MLYDFHRTQNARKPGSIHATYIVAGTRRPEVPSPSNGNATSSKTGGDAVMSDMSFPSSMPDHDDAETDVEVIPVTTVTLVKEEDLEGRFVMSENKYGTSEKADRDSYERVL
jgi:DNA polymerase delta subunit 3